MMSEATTADETENKNKPQHNQLSKQNKPIKSTASRRQAFEFLSLPT